MGKDQNKKDIYLKDLWPTNQEIQDYVDRYISSQMYKERYSNVFEGDQSWKSIPSSEGELYSWDSSSTYIANPTFFERIKEGTINSFEVSNANILVLFGDSVTTDHISPAGPIKKDSPAGKWLINRGVDVKDFNSYGSRRGNHEVMMRGTFANIRIRNEMLHGVEGGYTKFIPTGEQMSIYDAAMEYKKSGTELVVIAGKEYGTGSSRDWAAKGTNLQGVKAVIAESFERIHRSNLIGMGVLPLQFPKDVSRKTLKLDGSEKISIKCESALTSQGQFQMTIDRNGELETIPLTSRLDTENEVSYFKNGGILQYVLRQKS